jgi:hypothetical protein
MTQAKPMVGNSLGKGIIETLDDVTPTVLEAMSGAPDPRLCYRASPPAG